MLKKNIFYNFAYQILIMFLPFITAPYLSRVIGAEGIGVYSYSFSVATYFIYFSLLGISNYGNRTIASVKSDRELLSKVFCEIYCMQIITGLISLSIYTLYIVFISKNKIVASLQMILVMSSLFDVNWFFWGLEKFKLTVIRNFIIKVSTLILIFTFVKSQSDVYKYIIIMSLGTLLSQLSLWPFVRKNIDINIPSMNNIIKHFKPNLMLFIPVIAVSIYKIMDKIMLGQICGMGSVGYYESAEKIINVPVSLITAIGVVMMPKISSIIATGKYEDSKKYFDISMFLVLAFANAACFGIISISESFVNMFYGSDFKTTSIIMKYLSITIIFLAAGNVLRTQLLIPEKRDLIYIRSAILGAIINFTVNILFIPKMGVIGASIGTILAEMIVCIYQFIKVSKEINLKKYMLWECLFCIVGIFMMIGINLLPELKNIYLSIVLQVIVGGCIYCISIYILYIKKRMNNYIIDIN